MKRFIYLIIAAILLLSLPVMAAQKVAVFGAPNSSGTAPAQVDSDRIITIAADAGLIAPYEVITATQNTLGVADSGKTFIIDPTAETTLDLPDADVGMFFRFTANDGGTTKKFILEPQATDHFRGVVNSAAANTFATGDSVKSPGVTGDSIAIFCGQDTYWDVVDIRGTFTDNN